VRIALAAGITAAFFLGWLPASWSVALLFTLSVLTPRPRRSRRQKRPGYIRPSLNAYVNGNHTTATTPMPTATSTEFSVPPDIREAFTAGHEALADRLKTASPTPSGSVTESSLGVPMTAVKQDCYPTGINMSDDRWRNALDKLVADLPSVPPCEGCGDTPEAA
jgi:hypothetical protein